MIHGVRVRRGHDIKIHPKKFHVSSKEEDEDEAPLFHGVTIPKFKRDYHLAKMAPLKQRKVTVNGNGHTMAVGFNQRGNKHIYNDSLKRTNALQPSDLPKMDVILSKAEFVKKRGVSKQRGEKDKISRFYYYRTTLHGTTIYLHVAEESRRAESGVMKHNRYLYAVTSRLK